MTDTIMNRVFAYQSAIEFGTKEQRGEAVVHVSRGLMEISEQLWQSILTLELQAKDARGERRAELLATVANLRAAREKLL